jgi:hypothetical protein
MSRFVYLDESGTGNIEKEPHLLVAGVIANPDKHWRPIEVHLRSLAQKYAPDREPEDVVFHASEIFWGTESWSKYDYSERHALLRELCEVPAAFDLPMVTGYVDRRIAAQQFANDSKSEQGLMAHAAAYVRCAISAERYMRKRAESDELAQIVHENTDHAKKMIKLMHRSIRTRAFANYPNIAAWELSTYLPIERLSEATMFAEKADTRLLQIADICAFTCRRALSGKKDANQLFELFRPQLPGSEELDFPIVGGPA